jgi:hypothetical protein
MSEPRDAEPMEESTTRPSLPSSRLPYHRHRIGWLNGLVSILVVAGMSGVALALFSHHTALPARVVEGPGIRMVQAGGLTFVMRVTPGPYFLGELLEADLSLTNDSFTTYMLAGSKVANPCGAVIFVYMAGDLQPQYVLPVATTHSCPGFISNLTPGETVTLHEFLPISNSGEVTLESGARFLQTFTDSDGIQNITNGPSPLDGHWPSIKLSVAATTLADRQLTVQREGTLVQINAPRAALAHLYYIYTVTCNAIQGGYVYTGNFAWERISTTSVHEPNCGDAGDQIIKWSYAVSAPGFAIASEQVGT